MGRRIETFHHGISSGVAVQLCLLTCNTLLPKGELRRTDRVWTKGMADWQLASSVAGLFDDLPQDLETETTGASSPPPETVGPGKKNITRDQRHPDVADQPEPMPCPGNKARA